MEKLLNVTLNPNDMNGNISLSNNNLTISIMGGTNTNIRATHSKTRGKWYWEVKLDSGNNAIFIGVSSSTYPITSSGYRTSDSNGSEIRLYYGANGSKYPDDNTYGTSMAVGNIIGVALDMDNGTLEFYKNGVSQGISHTNVKDLSDVFPIIKSGNNITRQISVNFGNSPFSYDIPEGFLPYADRGFSYKILLLSNEKTYSFEKGGYKTTNAIPNMTSNNSPSGEAYTSRKGSTDYQVFDGVNSTGVQVITSENGRYNYEYKFPSKIKIGKYSIILGVNSGLAPKSWNFEGSNDGINYVNLGTVSNQTGWANNVERVFETENVGEYTYYRVSVTELNGASCYIYELKMFELLPPKISNLPSHSEQNLIKYGMDSPIQLDGIFSSKNYILQDTVSENAEGLWSTQINRKPLSIKFN